MSVGPRESSASSNYRLAARVGRWLIVGVTGGLILPFACGGDVEHAAAETTDPDQSDPTGDHQETINPATTGGSESGGGPPDDAQGCSVFDRLELPAEGGTAGSAGAHGSQDDPSDPYDAPQKTCGCGEGNFFVELSACDRTLRFEQPAPVSLLSGRFCDEYDQPGYFRGGACHGSEIAACSASGWCMFAGREVLTLLSPEGETVLTAKPGSGALQHMAGVTQGQTVVGSFGYQTDDEVDIVGQFEACVVETDDCLR